MWEELLKPGLTLGALGLLMGALLAIASRIFAVHVDERIEQVSACLPGANCGACGFAGCAAFAEAVVKGDAHPSGCVGGGPTAIVEIGKIMGLDVAPHEPRVAHVSCSGGYMAVHRFTYAGVKSCYAAARVAAGPMECTYACLGYGDCMNVCKFDAIRMEGGHAYIDRNRCTGCGMCAKICARGIIDLIPPTAPVFVNCHSRDRGAITRTVCQEGCIGCMLCVKKCQHDAIHVIDNLARIEYNKCVACGECMTVCPRGIIRKEVVAPSVLKARQAQQEQQAQ